MYQTILVTLDTSEADQAILAHIVPLARTFSSRIVLLHVADGWAARLHGEDAVSPEVTADRAYLAKIQKQLEGEGLAVETALAFGEPGTEIINWVRRCPCDLIAMGTHGHGFLGDLFLGSTAHQVRHNVEVPVLLVKVPARRSF